MAQTYGNRNREILHPSNELCSRNFEILLRELKISHFLPINVVQLQPVNIGKKLQTNL